MGVGKEFARKNSKYLDFDEGFIEGTFEGMKVVTKDIFGQEKEVMRYTISGKTFDSISGALASKMDMVQTGKHVKITRSGKGVETKYKVETDTGEVNWAE